LKRDQLWGVVVVVVVVVVGVGVIALLKEENRRKFHRKKERKNHVSNLFVFALSHPPAGLKRSSSLPR
jgi:uncharacterized membrane protein